MNMELMLDVGQANEIKLAARRAGATNADLKRLTEGDTFAQILPIIRGLGEVVITKHIVDLDANPMVPDGWTVEEHINGGKFKFDPKKIALYLDEEQQNGDLIVGTKLREKLSGKMAYNANLLDFYLAHTNLIPEEWKGKVVFFWGTIYRGLRGSLCVRHLIWFGNKWGWDDYCLTYDFRVDCHAAVPTSN